MSNQQKKLFVKGITSDTADELLVQGQDRYRLNVRALSSDNDTEGAVETVFGNESVSYTLPAGTSTTIGCKEDLIGKKIYYFLYNTAGNHSILEFNESASTITKVFQSSILNFQLNYLITGINIVYLDADTPLLYWTDNYNEPRKLNITKAKYFSAGNFTLGYKSPFDSSILYRIKTPPVFAPTYTWSTDSAQKINHLFKNLFQFKVQFVYDDKEISAWSPISKYVMPETELATAPLTTTGEDFVVQNNKITITVPTGSSIVTKIRVAAKEIRQTDFSLIAELNKDLLEISDDSTYSLVFYNDGNYTLLEVNESIKLYDRVPIKSQAQEIIKGARIVDGLITEEYDPVTVDIRLPISYNTYSFYTNTFFPRESYLKSGGIYKIGIVYYDHANRSGLSNVIKGKSTSTLGSTVDTNIYGTTLYVPFLTDPDYSPANPSDMDYVPIVFPEIYNEPPSWATHYQIVRSKNEAMSTYFQFVSQGINYLDDQKNVIPFPGPYTAAAYVSIGIGNIAGIYTTENPNNVLSYDFAQFQRIRFIANTTGAGPSYSLDTFFDFNDNEIIDYEPTDPFGAIVTIRMADDVPLDLITGDTGDEGGVLFEIYQPATNVLNDNELMYETGENYAITTDIHGNRVHEGTNGTTDNQLITTFTSATNPAADTYAFVTPTGHGLLVGNVVKVVTTGYSIFGEVSISAANLVTVDTTGYVIHGAFNGALPGTITRAAVLELTSGDSFRRNQDMPWIYPGSGTTLRLYSLVEAENASNMWVSNAWDYGRPNRIDENIKQVTRPATIYYSENLIPETDINGLSSVPDNNFESYNDEYGGIYKLRYRDQMLRVFKELKVGKIPVNMIVYNDASIDPNTTVGASNQVLGTEMQYYDGEFGIGRNPESYAEYGHVAYFYDLRRGAPVRLSTDGLTPIGDIAFMHNYFNDKSQALLDTGINPKIYGVYDTKFREYIIAFAATGGVSAETVAFNERANEWSTFYSYVPEFMCPNGIDIVSFKSGTLYKHNVSSQDVGTFYGVHYDAQIWSVCNIEPSKVKVFQAVSVETQAGETDDDIWLISSITSPNGQQTRMQYPVNWTRKENNYYAYVKMDLNTPNVDNPIVDGNPMRDRTFLVKFKYSSLIYNKLFAVNFYVIGSERSNK